MREIEGSIRDVLLVFADTTDKPNSDGHKWEIREILKGLEIPEDDSIARLWLHHAPSLAHGRAHRDNLNPPRPVDDDFQKYVDEMESVFDVILARFESKYLNVHAALDKKLLLENPTNGDARWLKLNVPNNQAALGYFFDQLKNPKWLRPMESEGLFNRPPEPIYEPERNSTYFPPWPQSRYLVRMAALGSSDVKTKVGEILLSLESSNFMVHLDIIDAACLLPIHLASRVAEKEITWLSNEGWIGHLVPEKLADFTVYLADGDRADVAIGIASIALSFMPNEIQETTEVERYFHPDPRTRMETWEWGRFINRCWPNLARADWEKTLDLFCGLLDECLQRKYPERINDGQSFSYIWQRGIEDDEDGVPNRLVATVRNIAERTVSDNSATLPRIIRIFESYRWDVFERVVLHLLRRFPSDARMEITKRLGSEKSFNDDGLFHEYVLLLAQTFQELGDDLQQIVLEWIDDSAPSIAEVKRRRFEWDGSTLSDEDADKSIRFRKLKWLVPLKDVLPEGWKTKYAAWTEELGHPDHPSYLIGGAQATWLGEPPASEVLSKVSSANEIVDYLLEHKDEAGESSQGLSRELHQLVQGDIQAFLAIIERFKGLQPIYVRAFLSGVQASSRSIPSHRWSELLRFINWVMEQPTAEVDLGDHNDHERADANWLETRSAVGRFVSSLLSAEPPELSFELRELVWTILKNLANDPNPTPEYEEKFGGTNMDPLTMSMNTIRGDAFHTIFIYIRWCRRHLGVEGSLESTPEALELLEQHLDVTVDSSLAIRAVYGIQLPFLAANDPNWVTSHLSTIFPEGARDLRLSAWETFIIWTSPWDNVFAVLKSEYARAIERLGEQSLYKSERSADHLAEHLVLLYARGKLGIADDDLFDRFYQHASDRLAAHVFWFIGRILKNEDVPEEVLERLALLVELRIANGQTHPVEMEAFGWILMTGKFDSEWSLRKLQETLYISPRSEPDNSIIEALATFAPAFPRIVIECVTLLVSGADTEWKIRYWSSHIRIAITEAYEKGEGDLATLLVNKLAAKGFLDFRDLLRSE